MRSKEVKVCIEVSEWYREYENHRRINLESAQEIFIPQNKPYELKSVDIVLWHIEHVELSSPKYTTRTKRSKHHPVVHMHVRHNLPEMNGDRNPINAT